MKTTSIRANQAKYSKPNQTYQTEENISNQSFQSNKRKEPKLNSKAKLANLYHMIVGQIPFPTDTSPSTRGSVSLYTPAAVPIARLNIPPSKVFISPLSTSGQIPA